MEEAISKLLVSDCIQEHFEPPYCVNPLSVAEGKTLRLVIDLRHVNPCLYIVCLIFWNKITGFHLGSWVRAPSHGDGALTKFFPGAVIFCDASDYAFGGFQIRLNDQPAICAAGVVLRLPDGMSRCVHFAAIFVNSRVSVVYLKFYLWPACV